MFYNVMFFLWVCYVKGWNVVGIFRKLVIFCYLEFKKWLSGILYMINVKGFGKEDSWNWCYVVGKRLLLYS